MQLKTSKGCSEYDQPPDAINAKGGHMRTGYLDDGIESNNISADDLFYYNDDLH